MSRKNFAIPPVAASDPAGDPRILTPPRKAEDPAGRPNVSRDPLYETDRYRLVIPITREPGRLEDAPALRPASD